MATVNSNTRFVIDHTAGTPDDPNLASPADLQAFLTDSTSSSLVASRLVSTSASGALDSVPVSTADSKAVSSGTRASTADSKALSASIPTSVADSKALSVSVLTSIADSKAVSVSNSVPVLTVVANSQNVSTAQSKAESAAAVGATADSKALSTAATVPSGRSTTTLATFLTNGAVKNVKDYGTTGTADDTSVFTAAIAASPTGAPVFVPDGTYLLANLSVPANTVLFANPGTATLKLKQLTTLSGSPILNVTGSNVTIQGLSFDGNKAVQPADGFSDSYDTGSNSTGRAYRSAIRMKDTGSLWSGLTVQNCSFTGTFGACVATQNIAKVRVINCVADSCNFEPVYLYADTAGASYFKGHQVLGNRFTNIGSSDASVNANAIVLSSAEAFVIADNYIDTLERCGVKGETVRRGAITGNTINSNSKDNFEGIQLQGTSNNVTIAGNHLYNVGRGIGLNPTTAVQIIEAVSIVGNTIKTTTGTTLADGIGVGSGAINGLVIADNVLKDIKRVGIILTTGTVSSDIAITGNVLTLQNTVTSAGITVPLSGGLSQGLVIAGNVINHGTTNSNTGCIVLSTSDASTCAGVVISNNSFMTGVGNTGIREATAIVTSGLCEGNVGDGNVLLSGTWEVGRNVASSVSAVSRVRTVLTTPYAVALTDEIVEFALSVPGAIAVTLPSAATARVGRPYTIKDKTGDARTNNITFGGAVDGTTLSIKENYGSVTVYSNGTVWSLISRGQRPSTAIASPTAPSAAYVQAEATSAKTAIDAIRTALVNAQISV